VDSVDPADAIEQAQSSNPEDTRDAYLEEETEVVTSADDMGAAHLEMEKDIEM